MPTINYTLRVVYPQEIDSDTAAEIEADAEPHDRTLEAKIKRWIGGEVSSAEEELSSLLPNGWYAVVDDLGD